MNLYLKFVFKIFYYRTLKDIQLQPLENALVVVVMMVVQKMNLNVAMELASIIPGYVTDLLTVLMALMKPPVLHGMETLVICPITLYM